MVNVRGEEIALLKKYAAELKEEIYKIPGIVDLEVTLEQDIPEFRLVVDRERAVDAGVMTGDIVRTVGALVGGQAVTTYEDEDGDAVNVRVRLPLALRQDPAQVEKLRLAVLQAQRAYRAGPAGKRGQLRDEHNPLGDQPAGPDPPGGHHRQPRQSSPRNGGKEDRGSGRAASPWPRGTGSSSPGRPRTWPSPSATWVRP